MIKPRRHGDLKHRELTERILGAAIEVHRHLGPGLLESVYETCTAHEFSLQKIPFESQKQVEILYKGVRLAADLRADFIVDSKVVVELKAMDAILPIHRAQLLTYMQLCKCEVGLLINFNSDQLMRGVERFVL